MTHRKLDSTLILPYPATPLLLKQIVEENHPSVVKVSRPTTAQALPTMRADKLDSVLNCTCDLTDIRSRAI